MAGGRDEAKVELLPGCRAFGLVHRGPYERIGDSYRRLLGEFGENGLGPGLPIREIYLIGPGRSCLARRKVSARGSSYHSGMIE